MIAKLQQIGFVYQLFNNATLLNVQVTTQGTGTDVEQVLFNKVVGGTGDVWSWVPATEGVDAPINGYVCLAGLMKGGQVILVNLGSV